MRREISYRRPTFYIPPYNYCFRFCEECDMDKACCTLFQTGMERELEAVMKGDDVQGIDYVMRELKENLSDALAMLGEAAAEQGIDMAELEAEAGNLKDEWEGKPSALLDEAKAFTRAVIDFTRDNREALDAAMDAGADLKDFFKYFPMISPKLARFLSTPERVREDAEPGETDELDREMEAADILSAQLAHRALVETEKGFLEIMRALPPLGDAVIDYLAKGKGIREVIEDEWLARENSSLEPIGDGPWWGPLENAEETIRTMREFRERRHRKVGDGER